ncbi:alpha/beta hydrolase [Sulfurimonas lithotrophica]|uniref:Alpha/beta hydrolase n=1 Tax=Sulfurimonas lithotrophica TaxID=2590022 RepID=A0A5P8P353_9BACT|nr:alpha/beta hydrolase [Sulfurimonas lithotrophica]QFR50183.1 alpha/beta hydrolase [Sulfurimonas lithotrophica]
MPFFFTSCALLDIKKNIQKQSNIAKINIRIESKTNSNIFIVLTKKKAKTYDVKNYTVVKKQSEVTFYVEPDEYKIFAFEDTNNDKKYSKDEYISISDNLFIYAKDKLNLVLKLRPLRKNENFNKDMFSINLDNSSAYLGDIVSLNSPVFSNENVSKGFWKPIEFVQDVEFGIFLLEKYNPNKKPVLFIHGVFGSPKHFSYLIEHLDHSKYQPFIAYYPSGFSASIISNILTNNTTLLQSKLGFEKISIIAHSLGGIIARDMLNRLNENNFNLVDKFISISAPYNGNIAAGFGVKNSPLVIPVWKDLDPNSEFLNKLYRKSLPKDTEAYLLFGIKGVNSTDGSVSIASQLRYKAQDEAKQIRGFDETHKSILESEKVSNMINKYLAN